MGWDEFVLRPGDRAGAWGRLVRTAHGTWFDPPLAVSLVLIHPRPVSPPSRLAVPVSGADFTRTAQRYELDGDLEGWATVGGVWTGSELRIDRHSRRRPQPDPTPPWHTPPCWYAVLCGAVFSSLVAGSGAGSGARSRSPRVRLVPRRIFLVEADEQVDQLASNGLGVQ